MNTDKDTSEEDKVTQPQDENQEQGKEIKNESDSQAEKDGSSEEDTPVADVEDKNDSEADDTKPVGPSDENEPAADKAGESEEETVEIETANEPVVDAEIGSEETAKEVDEPIAETEKEEPVSQVEQEVSDEKEISDTSKPAKEDNAEKTEVSADEEVEEEHVDYSNFSKKELLKSLKELTSTGSFHKIDNAITEIKSHFEDFFNKEKEEALQEFISNGGNEDDFQYRPSEEDREFLAVFYDFKEKKTAFFKEQEKQKEKNLYAKNQILDRLRELVDGEETTHSISTIKQIQDEWKKIGPVPSAQNRNLWASFNALMDRFYDNRSIYFELKELDRKKNLELKIELCEKAETLRKVEDLQTAIKTLNEFHEEFKHIGPVPREDQDKLWQRFKAASDAVYDRRKEFYESQKGVFQENLVIKEALVQKLESFKDFTANRIKDWNLKTKEVLAIQKEWESAGPVPKEVGREINKKFWSSFKQFFNNKNHFFKELDEIRLTNKIKAEELIVQAEALMDSTDWQGTANKLIALQQEWRELGPTPEKVRDALYKRFKSACDAFFENRRSANKQVNREFEQNLEAKKAICEKIIQESEGDDLTAENLENLIIEFNAIGFVPRKNMKEILTAFNEAVETYIEKLGIEGGNKEEFLFRLNLNKLQADPNGTRALNKKEHGIRKQISDLENNITLWKNNLEFFASSKTADKLKDQFDEKIEKAEKEIEKLKKKLSILREF